MVRVIVLQLHVVSIVLPTIFERTGYIYVRTYTYYSKIETNGF